MLFNEPKLLKSRSALAERGATRVSVLFNEPKLLKLVLLVTRIERGRRFSALQRAEIAEIEIEGDVLGACWGFSALQRAEIAEIVTNAPDSI